MLWSIWSPNWQYLLLIYHIYIWHHIAFYRVIYNPYHLLQEPEIIYSQRIHGTGIFTYMKTVKIHHSCRCTIPSLKLIYIYIYTYIYSPWKKQVSNRNFLFQGENSPHFQGSHVSFREGIPVTWILWDWVSDPPRQYMEPYHRKPFVRPPTAWDVSGSTAGKYEATEWTKWARQYQRKIWKHNKTVFFFFFVGGKKKKCGEAWRWLDLKVRGISDAKRGMCANSNV